MEGTGCTDQDESKPGIVYLSRIPRMMNVKHVREAFSMYGEVGRIFLQPIGKTEKRKNRVFTEGWVEFSDKHVARRIAKALNNMPVGGRRRTPWHSELWNIKYLPKFTWGLLNERMTYERAIHKRRLRTEIAIAKRETAQYIAGSEQLKHRKKKKSSAIGNTDIAQHDRDLASTSLSETVPAESKRKKADKASTADNSFLKSLFSGGIS